MRKLQIYCTSIKYFKILDDLPGYITPIGLGNSNFPDSWITEKKGDNISNLNSYYGEMTALYWIWKNQLNDLSDDDFIGNCHYRKLWLNNLYDKKQKNSLSDLYSNLLKNNNENLNKYETIQVQPIIFNSKTVLEDFNQIHGELIINKCIEFLNPQIQEKFKNNLNKNTLYPLNMFITKVRYFKNYCDVIFPWLEKCFHYCKSNNLLKDYNTRLPAFLAERFTSFWFSEYSDCTTLSYARIGRFFLSNNINEIYNPMKLPFTFRMYPTIHKY